MESEAMHVEVERQFLAAVLDLLGNDAHADAVRGLLKRVPFSLMQGMYGLSWRRINVRELILS